MKSIINDSAIIRLSISKYNSNLESLKELPIQIKKTKSSVFLSPNKSKTWKNVGESIYLKSQSIGYNTSTSFETFCKNNMYARYSECTMGLIGIKYNSLKK